MASAQATEQRSDHADQPSTDAIENSSDLKRLLTGRQLTMIAIGGAIGTGLFLGSSLAISQAGPSVIVAYVLCGLVALVIAFALAEMAVVHPTAGGFGAIAHSYIGPWAGFVLRWTYWSLMVIVIGGEVIAAGIYMRYWWPGMPLWLPVAIFSLLVLTVNAAAVRLFGELEYWFSMVKVTAIAVFILLGIAAMIFGLPEQPATGLSNLTSHGGFMPHGITGLGTAMVFVLFSYMGTEVVSVTAAEAENPARDVPKAARGMILRLLLFYILAIVVMVTVLPWTVVAEGGSLSASPFVKVFSSAGIPAAAGIMNFVVLTAALSAANTNLYLTTRMMHSLAGHGYAPRWTGRLSRHGVPRNALLLSALGLLVAVVLSWQSDSGAYIVLFGIAIFGAIVVWILILLTHTVFRWRRVRSGLPRSPVQLWGAPLTSGLAAAFLLAVLGSTFFIKGLDPAWKFGIPYFATLLLIFAIVRRRTVSNADDDLLALKEEVRIRA
jgi:L-asparagine transporter-like permease